MSEISCIFHHSQNGSFRSHQILKVNCQRIKDVGCRFQAFHGQATDKLPTSYRQATDKLPTGYRHITNSRPTVGRLSVHCRPTGSLYFGQNLSADRRPTVGRLSADS